MTEQDTERQSGLKPSLSLFDASAVSVGAIIGAGIFVVTGIAAGYAGSALVVSMIIAAIIASLTTLSLAELTAWQPREGGIYEYTYQLVSPFAGFLTGWMWIVSNTFAGAAVSLGFAHYLTALFPSLSVNLVAAVLCIAFTALNYYGVRQSAVINNFLVITKLLVLAFFIIFGLAFMNTTNFAPFAPLQVGVFYGASYIFFAYGGFARVAVIAEEVKDAKKNVPKAMLLSLLISTLFYILVGLIAVGLVGANRLAGSDSPLREAISVSGNAFAVYIVSIGGLLATASVLLTSVLGVSRMAYAMARRKDLPEAFIKLHPKHVTPYYSIWIVGILMALFVLFINLSRVVAISTFALLFYYALANLSALNLKAEKRLYPRLVPVLGILTCLALFAFIPYEAIIIGAIGLIGGAVYYAIKISVRKRQ